MGYEIMMHLVESLDPLPIDDGLRYGRPIVSVDMHKCNYEGAFYNLIQSKHEKQTEPTHFMFAEDGDTKIIYDRYDQPLTEADPYEVLAALDDEIETAKQNGETPYNRFMVARNCLASFIEDFFLKGYEVRVLFCGY